MGSMTDWSYDPLVQYIAGPTDWGSGDAQQWAAQHIDSDIEDQWPVGLLDHSTLNGSQEQLTTQYLSSNM